MFSSTWSTSSAVVDEVLLLAATRGRAVGAVETLKAGAPLGGYAVDRVIESRRLDCPTGWCGPMTTSMRCGRRGRSPW